MTWSASSARGTSHATSPRSRSATWSRPSPAECVRGRLRMVHRDRPRPRHRSTGGASPSLSGAAADLRAEPGQRVELPVHHPLLQRDDAVVGEVDALGADLAAALRDVAVAQPEVLLGGVAPVDHVERVHVQLGQPDQEPRPGEGALVLLVVADDVAGVLAEVALDALAELLRALDVHLLHPVVA